MTTTIDLENMFNLSPGQDGFITASNRRSRKVKYWKMCDRPGCQRHKNRKGWVTTGPTISEAYAHAEFTSLKHMTELPDSYGVELEGSGWISTPKNDGNTRFLPILQNGGLHEFPGDQVVALGWHHIPDVYNALTPEQRSVVDRITATQFICEYGCFENGRPRTFYREDLLARHVKSQHKDAMQATAIGNTMQKAIAKQQDPELIAGIIAATMDAISARQPVSQGRGRHHVANDV